MAKSRYKGGKRGFVHDWGVFNMQTMVLIGMDRAEDMAKALPKLRVNVKNAVALIKYAKTLPAVEFLNPGLFIAETETNTTCIMLRAWPRRTSWNDYETLMHELHHLVRYALVTLKGMADEPEAQAYAQEGLFRAIRRKLDGTDESGMVWI